jgi:uncharacterized protein YndB with AHSA1/START domain
MSRVKFNCEFSFKASPTIVYEFLTSPDCLTRWFCDDCAMTEDSYTYAWEGSEELAYILEDIEEEYLSLQWEDYPTEYLEFKISKGEITGQTVLEITAFCDDYEVKQEKAFWQTQMNNMKHAMGL